LTVADKISRQINNCGSSCTLERASAEERVGVDPKTVMLFKTDHSSAPWNVASEEECVDRN